MATTTPTTSAGTAKDDEFGEKFYSRIIRLLNSDRTEAAEELTKLYEQTVAIYEHRGWTEHWKGGNTTAMDIIADTLDRNKKATEKPLAPVKRDTKITPPDTLQSTTYIAPATIAMKRPLNIEVNIFGDDDDVVPRKKPLKVSADWPSSDDPMDTDNSSNSSSLDKSLSVPAAAAAAAPTTSVSVEKTAAPVSFASDMTCTLCGDLSVDIGNTLVTCEQCSHLFHQNCHDPEILSSELRDPRFIFVCTPCKQRQSKISAPFKLPVGSQSTLVSTGAKEVVTAVGKTTKPSDKLLPPKPPIPTTLFKPIMPAKDRPPISTLSSPVNSPAKGSGIASLAADFLAKQRAGKISLPLKSESTVKPTTVTPTSSPAVPLIGVARLAGIGAAGPSPSAASSSTSGLTRVIPRPVTAASSPRTVVSPMVGAEKRLQLMKKKAALGKPMLK